MAVAIKKGKPDVYMFLDFLAFTMYLSISVEHYEHIIYVVDFMLGMG